MRKRSRLAVKLKSETTVRVRFSEVDSMQVVWHGDYVRYLEDGREDFGRKFAGLGYMDFYAHGYTAPIVDLSIQYKRSLTCNDTAIVETRYLGAEGAKICFEYEIRRESDGEVVATGSSTQVFLDSAGELQLLPPSFYIIWKEKWELL
ncbi:MAG: acyl-CoA thioesterase [Phocaeicola sp.]